MKQLTIIAIMIMSVVSAFAGGVTYKNGDKYVKLGGRIQLQYHSTSHDGDTSDELIFRRMRPYIEGSVYNDWKGKFQWDMGKGAVELKDAYFEYKGLDNIQVLFGNVTFPFSREQLTSSKHQQLVERTFVGNHNYGTPDRQAGVHFVGNMSDSKITWGASICKAAHDPDEKKLDFGTIISLEKGDDWGKGNMFGGRIDFHPLGNLKMSQGDFERKLKATIGVGAFTWKNDKDNINPYVATGTDAHTSKLDLDTVSGFEISGAVRGVGISVDTQYNTFNAELIDAGINSGIYKNSETTLSSYSVKGGYMIIPSKLELVGNYQSQNADGYATDWNKTSIGINYFVKKQDVKYQLTYQMGQNKDGKIGNDEDEVYLQTQYVF